MVPMTTFFLTFHASAPAKNLRTAAFEGLIGRQHRPTIERSLTRLLNDEQELRRGEVAMPNQTPLDWMAKIPQISLFRD
jgi:hypothetical protein